METPEDIQRAYQHAEESETKYKNIHVDPQFSRMMELMLILSEKYSASRLARAISYDYRNKNWIHLFSQKR